MHPTSYPAHTGPERCSRCGARHDRWATCTRHRLDPLRGVAVVSSYEAVKQAAEAARRYNQHTRRQPDRRAGGRGR
jgi:hypothetical protein